MSAEIFRDICVSLHQYHKKNGGKKTYEEVVNMVLKTKYGQLVNDSTFDDLGIVFGLSRQAVQQIEATAKRKLQNPDSKKRKKLYDYLK